MSPVISVNHLKHLFGDFAAVDDLTFEVGQGEIFGLLGPNGAGKTTTVRLLNGLYEPVSGQIHVLGFDPVTQGADVRSRTGVLTETPALYERLTARQNLEFFADLADMKPVERKARIDELLGFFELTKRADDKAGTYSKGMKQRLALARALLIRPELVFLDEPTSGLDPESAAQVNQLIIDQRQREKHTVFLCTHNLFEAQRLCDRVGIMGHGRLLAVGSLDELRRQVAPGLWVQVDLWQEPAAGFNLGGLTGLIDCKADGKKLRVQLKDEAAIPPLVTELVRQGAQIYSIAPQQVSLEEIYFTLQGNHNGNGGAK